MIKKSLILTIIAIVYGSCSYFGTEKNIEDKNRQNSNYQTHINQTPQREIRKIYPPTPQQTIRVASNTNPQIQDIYQTNYQATKNINIVSQEPEETQEKSLDEKIGNMLMIGFFGTSVSKNSQICQDIYNYNLGGVILFDYNPIDKSKPKNISSKAQLKRLTKQLKECSRDGRLLIAVDQEGGKVQRLKSRYGFYGKFPKPKDIAKQPISKAKRVYQKMAEELNEVGINYNLAPVVDLAINRKNRVIYKLGRSFGKDPKKVAKYASAFIDEMQNYNILTSAKHFPGHGSSLGDTHKGFVDVTNSWKKIELEPYRILNQIGKLETVMVAHVFNRKIDPKYPATLSKNTIDILRDDIGFEGVIITDDLQMGAITKHYSLRDVLRLSINAGDNILLFGNQLSPKNMVSVESLVNTIKELLQEGAINIASIEESNRLIDNIKK